MPRCIQHSRYQLHFVERGDPGRRSLEQHIHATYANAYSADIKDFMPTLISLESAGGELLGAMGIRTADKEPLLLEQYFDRPIEEIIQTQTKRPASRTHIIELGNLAAGSPGAARILIMALNAYLQGAGFDWVVFTAVPSLRNAFSRIGLDLVDLGQADGARLGARQSDWGTYYEHKPSVMAGDVHYGFGRLTTLMKGEQIQHLCGHLWRHALYQGRSSRSLCA